LGISIALVVLIMIPWAGNIRILSYAIVSALFLGLGAFHLLLQRPLSAFRTTLAVSFLGLPLVIILCLAIVQGDIMYLYLNPSPWAITLFVASFMLQMLMIFGLVLVAKERDEAALRVLAETDSLTGIYNRRAFFQGLQNRFRDSLDTCDSASVILMDLDDFKLVNDTHGHEVGDWVLQHFCAVVQAAIRENDVFARFGGEEFVLFLPGAGREEACAIAERIHGRLFDSHQRHDDALPRYTVSLGICTGQANSAHELDKMIGRGDQALYYAKSQGKDCSAWCTIELEVFEIITRYADKSELF
jgi:diguanylate cyclase (GGDEF)-like protein